MASILDRKKNLKPATPKKKTREDYAQDALYREVWEDVNNEKTIAFLKKYSKQMIGAALGILVLVAGYQIAIRTYHANQMAMAVNYETALEKTDVNALAQIGEHGRGANADLALFQSYTMDQEKDIKKLEKLAEHGNTRDFRDLARLHVVGQNRPFFVSRLCTGPDIQVQAVFAHRDFRVNMPFPAIDIIAQAGYPLHGDRPETDCFPDAFPVLAGLRRTPAVFTDGRSGKGNAFESRNARISRFNSVQPSVFCFHLTQHTDLSLSRRKAV